MFMAIGAEAKKPWNGFLPKGKMPNPQFQSTGNFSSGYGRGSGQQKRKKTSGGGGQRGGFGQGQGYGFGYYQ
jgi:hypothetical protein